MAAWLVKTEPEEYSARDLEKQGRTVWDGVSNPLALKHLRSMHPGDPVLIYHTGQEKAVVAEGVVESKPRPDPRDRSGRAVLVELGFRAWLPRPVSLAEIKADAALRDCDLVRLSRLSVMPLSEAHLRRIRTLSRQPAPGAGAS